MSSGTYTWCSLWITTGMPLPLFHTDSVLFSWSTSTCVFGGVVVVSGEREHAMYMYMHATARAVGWVMGGQASTRSRHSTAQHACLDGVHGGVALLVVRGVDDDLVEDLVEARHLFPGSVGGDVYR